MKSRSQPSSYQSHRPLALILGGLASIFGFSAQAGLAIPEVPLQTGSAVPANIWFILDDSGSMDWDFMPDSVPAISTPSGFNFARQTFARNTVYYNPATTYQPWRRWDGSFFPVTLPTAAWSSTQLASGGTTNLTASDKFFYVPKVGATNLADGRQYWRYRLRTTGVIERTELTFASGSWAWRNPVTLASVTWTTPNGPVTRSAAQEWQNYATWYSYSRTRNKVAKGGASAAFSGLGEDVRVGFSTIWNRSTFDIPVQSDGGLFRDQGGSTNRSTWFNRLHTATASGSTPLRNALTRAGQYYSRTDADGPYGPEPTNQQLACRQNFSILTTDGFWNGTSPGNPNIDGNRGPLITGPNNPDFQYDPFDPTKNPRPFIDAHSDTLADVAMNNWYRDLRPDLSNIVPTSAADEAFWQHSVTFGLSIGLRGKLNPETDLPALKAGTLLWPPPAANSINNIDDLWHAAVNGRGEFVAATDPQAFSDGLKDALATITERVGSASSASFDSTSLAIDTRLFVASFIGGKWTGELLARELDQTQSPPVEGPIIWQASAGIPAPASRKIFTWNGSAGANFPTSAQVLALGGTAVADYLRGDQSGEQQNGGGFRDRQSVLGDIIDSSPVFVKSLNGASADDTIFVGANDGMLHAVNANDGSERFTYVPGGINMANLKKFADPNYAHRYFVDGPILVSDPLLHIPGKRILIGSLGRGGNGLFALDVSDPANFAAIKVMWDLPVVPDLGVLTGQPFIAKLNNGKVGVIMGNGPNSIGDKSKLVIIDIETGALIKTLNTNLGTALATNGLSSPAGVDEDTNGTLDFVYAGDLQGRVWKFDVGGNNPAQWKVALSGAPLFIAKGPTGVLQPISGGMASGKDPATFKTWVWFGTGRYLTNGDPADPLMQTWYGLIDEGATIPSVTDRTAATSTLRSRMFVGQGEILRPSDNTVFQTRGFEFPRDGDMEEKQGWLLDLVSPDGLPEDIPVVGERMVGSQIREGETLVALSIVPTNDPCGNSGVTWVNAVDPFTGASLGIPQFDLDGNRVFDDFVPNADEIDPQNPTGPKRKRPANSYLVKRLGIGAGIVGSGSSTACPPGTNLVSVTLADGTIAMQCMAAGSGSGRISWREVIRE
ncbi:MAG: pilus assembly protein [Lysobacterales bacterium]